MKRYPVVQTAATPPQFPVESAAAPSVNTQPMPSTDPESMVVASPTPGGEHAAQVSANSSGEDHSNAHTAATGKPAKPKVDAKDVYKQEKPSLMGLTLGADKETVLARFGKAKNQFVMDEDAEPIAVYEYADFSVGFNSSHTLEFVDVHSAEIDPGLGGLRLGQKAEEAISVLGKPNASSKYVLAYKAQRTVLKLDMDPKENTIQSIKLFRDN